MVYKGAGTGGAGGAIAPPIFCHFSIGTLLIAPPILGKLSTGP